jgi:hypothetical protein
MGVVAPQKAEILLFTGIRYERLEGHPAGASAKPPAGHAKKH